jgi:GntR family transcriptional regulator, galactonate operon transcriptional repressor
MMKDRTYPRRGLHGQLVHDIGVRILRGELRPGDSLVMDAEADGETVSRTVVREAIKVLAAKGLVVARPRTGTHVRDRRYWNLMDPDVLAWRLEANPGDDFFVDVFELRRLIEPAAAGLAAGRAGPAEIEELETALAAMETAVHDRDAYLAADLRFHTVILEASHNELLAHLGGTLRAVFRASFARTLPVARVTIGQHAAVAEAIREGNGVGAEAAMLALIERTAASLGEDALVAAAASPVATAERRR